MKTRLLLVDGKMRRNKTFFF